nr:hypothetical protein [Tanacetum cinerariifolium]
MGPAHRQAGSVFDNQIHSEDYLHSTHMSMSRIGAVEENNSEEHESDSEQDTDGSESDSKYDQQDDDNDADKSEGDGDRGMDIDDVQDEKADSTPLPLPKSKTTNIPSLIPYFSSVFRFNDRVVALEKDVAELKNDPLHTQMAALVDDHIDTRMGETREEFMNFLLASLTDTIT